ncbi:type II secretion system minor pseudopilin GspJ [Sphingosinicella terrae]|uniref:type II secretion system minor pseudopilin GspJ n=1 Tax=Sphingosinicella terrae TaxID=2172047 RepID=UPI000E0D91F2|nr:type II secretion system minor pseudopilin GspJ [Sphingosinicella terrae]
MKREGFTLVEMLIALSIFGMLTAAGVTLLGVSARTQETSDRLLAEVGETRRLGALLGADLALAVPRVHRDELGRPLPAFAGGARSPLLLDLVRRGWDEGEGASLQRVGYRLRDGRLERLSFPRVDGGGDPVAARLIDGVSAIRLRYRDDEGEWRDDWAPTDPTRLPTAVELVTASETQGTIRQLFLVGVPQR